MTIFAIVLAVAGLPVLAASLYLFILTLVARAPGFRATLPNFRTRRRFVIVVPAHNEATGIGRTLESLERLVYRRDHRRVLVVADNCTDQTATIARQHGAEVLVRTDTVRRGKGYALDFAFRQLLAESSNDWHAAVVVDADSVVSPNFLQAISARLDNGARAVQATYLSLPRQGALAVITQVALTAMHVVRTTARDRMRLSVGLKGNGMAFTRALLATHRHAAYSRTEDLEFGVQLAMSGVRVAYAADAVVWGDMPTSNVVATRQRERWIGGRMEVAQKYLGWMLRRALRLRSIMLVDTAVDLLVPPVSVLAAATVAGTAAALTGVLGGALPAAGSVALAVWGGALVALAAHVADAAVRTGNGWSFLGVVANLPGYAIDKLRIVARAPRQFGGAWMRTTRAGEAA